MTTRVPLLELGSLQSRLPDLIAKKGEPPWSGDPLCTASRPASSAVTDDSPQQSESGEVQGNQNGR